METIRDVIIKLKVEQEKFQLQVPDMQPITDLLEELTKGTREYQETSKDAFLEMLEDLKDVEKSFEEIKEAQEEATIGLQDAGIKGLESTKMLGEGALKVARGFSLLGISAEEDLRVVIEKLAMVQAVTDSFSGGIDVIKGVVEAQRAWRAGTTALTAAQTASAAATTASGAAAAGAAPGFVALNAAMGPVGIAAIAITAALGGTLLMMQNTADASEDLGDDFQRLGKKASKTQDEIEALQKQMLEDAFLEEAPTLSKAYESVLATQSEVYDLRKVTMYADSVSRLKQVEEARLKIFNDQRGIIEGGFFGDVEALGGVQSSLQTLLEIDRERLDLLQAINKEHDAELNKQRSIVDQVQKAVDIEMGRLQTLDEIVGRLDSEQLLRFEQLSKKAQSGDLSSGELKELESLGGQGVSDFTSKQFQQLGQQRGAVDLFTPFGQQNGDRLRQLQQALEVEKANLDDFSTDVRELQRANKEAIEELGHEMIGIIQALNQDLADVKKQVGNFTSGRRNY